MLKSLRKANAFHNPHLLLQIDTCTQYGVVNRIAGVGETAPHVLHLLLSPMKLKKTSYDLCFKTQNRQQSKLIINSYCEIKNRTGKKELLDVDNF